jgi:hypothetical protein
MQAAPERINGEPLRRRCFYYLSHGSNLTGDAAIRPISSYVNSEPLHGGIRPPVSVGCSRPRCFFLQLPSITSSKEAAAARSHGLRTAALFFLQCHGSQRESGRLCQGRCSRLRVFGARADGPATAPRGGIHLPARPNLFLYGDS